LKAGVSNGWTVNLMSLNQATITRKKSCFAGYDGTNDSMTSKIKVNFSVNTLKLIELTKNPRLK
jgi:hypothetical protein